MRRTRNTLALSIYEQLKLDITHWVIRPGQRLTEETIARRFNVSRTPIREALKKLEQEQLVIHTSNHGYSTQELSLAELDDVYSMRVVLEEFSATLATNNQHMTSAKETLTKMREIWNPANIGEIPDRGNPNLVYADEGFHEGIALAAGNRFLHRTLKSLNEKVRIIRITDFGTPSRIQATYEQHTQIVAAILGGDVDEAQLRMKDHVGECQRSVRSNALEALLNIQSQQNL